MAEVVNQGRGDGIPAGLGGEARLRGQRVVAGGDALEEPHHDVGGADGVGKARVLGAGKDQRREPELANPAQALNLPGLEESHHDTLGVALEGDEAMDWVPENHGRNLRDPNENGHPAMSARWPC